MLFQVQNARELLDWFYSALKPSYMILYQRGHRRTTLAVSPELSGIDKNVFQVTGSPTFPEGEATVGPLKV